MKSIKLITIILCTLSFSVVFGCGDNSNNLTTEQDYDNLDEYSNSEAVLDSTEDHIDSTEDDIDSTEDDIDLAEDDIDSTEDDSVNAFFDSLGYKSFDGDVILSYDAVLYKKNDGTVWGKGANSEGQLGNGQRTDSYEWSQVLNINNAVKIFSTKYNCRYFALTEDGELYRWGQNHFSPEKIDVPSKIVDVTCNLNTTRECPPIIKCEDGKRYLIDGECFIELDFQDIKHISLAGKNPYYFILLDGRLYKCIPKPDIDVYYLEFDNNGICEKTFSQIYSLEQIECDDMLLVGGSSISDSSYEPDSFYTYFVDSKEGEVFSCKYDDDSSSLKSSGGHGMISCYNYKWSGEDNNSFSLFANGKVSCSGNNKEGQLGDGTYEDLRHDHWYLEDYNFVRLTVLNKRVAAIDSDNNVWAWGEGFNNIPEVIISSDDFSN